MISAENLIYTYSFRPTQVYQEYFSADAEPRETIFQTKEVGQCDGIIFQGIFRDISEDGLLQKNIHRFRIFWVYSNFSERILLLSLS